MATLIMEQFQGALGLKEGTIPWRLMRFYGGPTQEYSVLIEGGVASTFPGIRNPTMGQINAADVGSGYAGHAAFMGGYLWREITHDEQVILEAAGYTVEPPLEQNT